MTFCCDFLRFEEDGVYGRTTPGIKYVHKKDEWLGYGDYAVVLVSGNFSPASAINKWARACGVNLRRESSGTDVSLHIQQQQQYTCFNNLNF
jgi:hypothetical protein